MQSYTIRAKVWIYQSKVAWHFITIPKKQSGQIRFVAAGNKSAWGSIPVRVTLGKTSWNTSLFPVSQADKSASYLLPLKASVRNKEKVLVDRMISVTLEVSD